MEDHYIDHEWFQREGLSLRLLNMPKNYYSDTAIPEHKINVIGQLEQVAVSVQLRKHGDIEA